MWQETVLEAVPLCGRRLPFPSYLQTGGAQRCVSRGELNVVISHGFGGDIQRWVCPCVPGQQSMSLSMYLPAGAAVFLVIPVVWSHALVYSVVQADPWGASDGFGDWFSGRELQADCICWRSASSAFLPMPKAGLKVGLTFWNLLKTDLPCFL